MTKSSFGLLLLCLIFITAVSLGTLIYFGKKESYKPGVSAEYDKAASQARKAYEDKKKARVDFSDGPCLTNDLITNWALDLVHNPREKIDDLKENQCQSYLEGRTKHFIEMDQNGNIVRIK
jgi:hypothetical protein